MLWKLLAGGCSADGVVRCRPMGTSLLVAVKDRDGPQLYLVDPSGTALVPLPLRFHCCRDPSKHVASHLRPNGPLAKKRINYGPSLGLMPQRYFGTAVGKGRQGAKTEIERLDLSSLTCRQGVTEVAKMCDLSHPPFARATAGSALKQFKSHTASTNPGSNGSAANAPCQHDATWITCCSGWKMQASRALPCVAPGAPQDSCALRLVDLGADRLNWAGAWHGAACTACMTRRSLSSSR